MRACKRAFTDIALLNPRGAPEEGDSTPLPSW